MKPVPVPVPPPVPPKPSFASGYIDPTDAIYGCVPGTDCTAGLQQAIDAAAQGPQRGVILAAPGDWIISRPLIIDHPNITLWALPGARLKVDLYNPCDVIAVGIARTNMAGQQITSANFYTAGGLTGARLYNPVTGGSSWIQVQNYPFAYGPASPTHGWPYSDHWDEVQQVTIDCHFDQDPTGQWADWTHNPYPMLFGMGDLNDSGHRSYPFSCWLKDDTTVVFSLHTADIACGANFPDHYWTFSLTGMARPYQLRITIDLVAGAVHFYDCTPATPVELSAAFTESWAKGQSFAAGKLHFARNLNWPMMVGMRGQRGNWGNPATRMVLYGLQFQTGLVSGAFAPTVATDHSIAYFPPFDPTQIHAGRFLRAATGVQQGYFTFWVPWFNGEDPGIPPDRVRLDGLEIECAPGRGAGVLIGSTFGTTVLNCHINGGAVAVANVNIGGNWPVVVDHCTLGGFDTAYYGFFQIATLRDIRIIGAGYDVIRFTGSQVTVDGLFAPTAGAVTQQFYTVLTGGEGGGGHALRGITYDNEGWPQTCGVYMEQCIYGFTTLQLDQVSLGQAGGASGPAILLQRMYNYYNGNVKHGHVTIHNLAFGNIYSHAAIVQCHGRADVTRDNTSPAPDAAAYNDSFEW